MGEHCGCDLLLNEIISLSLCQELELERFSYYPREQILSTTGLALLCSFAFPILSSCSSFGSIKHSYQVDKVTLC